MTCHNCKIEAKKFGKDRKGNQRYRCNKCRKTFQEIKDRLLGNMYLSEEKALLVLTLLVEGTGLRSIERITGVNMHTILDLLVLAGERCERLMKNKIKSVAVREVQADEIWSWVRMKEKTKVRKGIESPRIGDAYTFVAIERHTKLILTWRLGRRDYPDTEAFIEQLNEATTGRFQLTTDGFAAYPGAVSYSPGTRVDYAQLIKVYAKASNATLLPKWWT